MMKRPLLTLITLLLCTKAHGSSVIRWDAAHVKELEEIGIIARKEAIKAKKSKSSKSSKEKETKSSKEKKSKSSKGSAPAAADYDNKEEDNNTDNNNNTDTNNEDNNENTQSAITTECSDIVLAIAPVTYCNDWIPGIGRKECDNDNSASRGGEVCNIVSMAWLRALKQDNVHVDLVLNHAGLCRDVIEQGPVTESDILNVLPEGFGIAIVHMTGSDIKKALQQGAKAAYDGDPKAYPYGYGIRYSIDYANLSVDEGFVYNIQVKPNGLGGSEAWVEIDDLQTYFVATNSMLASGEGGYDVFLDVPGVDKDILIMYSDADLFIKYAKQKCELDAAPYSTYSFAGLNALLSGAYSCLEDKGLCECGFC
jgi:hypothetical protein